MACALSDGWDGTYANDAVRAIYEAYIGDGRITQPVDIIEIGDGRHENRMTFRDRAAYDAWYAEIDAIDTSPLWEQVPENTWTFAMLSP